jgi:hypothetical protein
MSISIVVRDWIHRNFGSLDHDRLANFIRDSWIDLDREIHNSGHSALLEPWARSAYILLLRAEDQLSRWEIEGGWAAALSAQRAILSNLENPERIKRVAIALRREADKITGWRAKAIYDLMAEPKGEAVATGPQDLMRVIDAVALRDDFSQNTWFKILLRRRHLSNLFVILWMAILLCWTLSWLHILPGFLGEVGQVSMVILFGVLGAAVSVAQSLVAQDVSERIPAQQVGALVIWMRPGIGAAAALVVFAMLHANEHFAFLGPHTTEPAVIAVFSFLAGYSERFIIGALERLSQSSAKEKS